MPAAMGIRRMKTRIKLIIKTISGIFILQISPEKPNEVIY